MKIRRLRVFALFIAFALLMTTFAFAVETRASEYILSESAQIKAIGGGDIRVSFKISCYYNMNQIGAQKIVIYKSNGTVAKTFLSTDNGNEDMMGSGTGQYSGSIDYSGRVGEKYYAVVTFYVKNSSGSDTKTYTTTTVTA